MLTRIAKPVKPAIKMLPRRNPQIIEFTTILPSP
jgi:hypothetical protein